MAISTYYISKKIQLVTIMIYHIESIIDLHEHTQNVLQNWQNTPNNFLPTHTFDDPTSTRFRFLPNSLDIHFQFSSFLFLSLNFW